MPLGAKPLRTRLFIVSLCSQLKNTHEQTVKKYNVANSMKPNGIKKAKQQNQGTDTKTQYVLRW